MQPYILIAEQEKKKYLEAVQTRCATFTPFVVSIEGVLGSEANVACF